MEEMRDKLEQSARGYAGLNSPDQHSCKNSLKREINFRKYMAFRAGARWQKENMWISVEEKPESDEDYFFMLNIYTNPPTVGVCEYDKENNEWMDVSSYCPAVITHYMPIPKHEFEKGE